MHILHVAPRLCIRTLKQCQVLQDAGHTITLAIDTIAKELQNLATRFPLVHLCNPRGRLHMADAHEVVHLHTSTHNPTLPELFEDTRARLVWDIHDWVTECKHLVEVVDHCIVPSEGYRKYVQDASVVYSKVPKAWHPEPSERRYDLCLTSGVNKDPWYRDYRPADKAMGSMDIFTANYQSDLASELRLFQTMDYQSLLRRMSEYKRGYAGPSNNRGRIDHIVTNKFWEYLACGLDIEFGPWGDPAEMAEVLARVKAGKESIYMESELEKLERAYGKEEAGKEG